jgi:HPt (histidine-containing phosphotransfer) domain-containing protein
VSKTNCDVALAASHAVPVYDPAVLQSLPMVADGSLPGFAAEMRALFARSHALALADLDAALADRDETAQLRLVHTIKSSSAQVGAMELSALARDYENALRAGQPASPVWPAQLRAASERLQQAWLGQPDKPPEKPAP